MNNRHSVYAVVACFVALTPATAAGGARWTDAQALRSGEPRLEIAVPGTTTLNASRREAVSRRKRRMVGLAIGVAGGALTATPVVKGDERRGFGMPSSGRAASLGIPAAAAAILGAVAGTLSGRDKTTDRRAELVPDAAGQDGGGTGATR